MWRIRFHYDCARDFLYLLRRERSLGATFELLHRGQKPRCTCWACRSRLI